VDSKVKDKGAEPLHPLPVVDAFERWSLDFIGRLPVTANGNRWIIVAVDSATKWVVARALKEATGTEVAKFIYEEIVSQFGVPNEVLSDRGANFAAHLLESYLTTMGIKHKMTSAYHPRSNGAVERVNGTLGKMLTKFCAGRVHKWDTFLHQVLLAYRTQKHKTTGFTPAFLVFGKEPRLPGADCKPFIFDDKDAIDCSYWRAETLEELGQARAAAAEREKAMKENFKENYDTKIVERGFKEGDWVLMKNPNKTKFESVWLGPYRVVHVAPFGTYKLEDTSRRKKADLVHGDKLKLALVDGRVIDGDWSGGKKIPLNSKGRRMLWESDNPAEDKNTSVPQVLEDVSSV
jgi:transposase InsO family protein